MQFFYIYILSADEDIFINIAMKEKSFRRKKFFKKSLKSNNLTKQKRSNQKILLKERKILSMGKCVKAKISSKVNEIFANEKKSPKAKKIFQLGIGRKRLKLLILLTKSEQKYEKTKQIWEICFQTNSSL